MFKLTICYVFIYNAVHISKWVSYVQTSIINKVQRTANLQNIVLPDIYYSPWATALDTLPLTLVP